MKSAVILFWAMLFVLPAMAQDKIVKINNDTIRAKVLKITKDKIQFRYPGKSADPVSEIHKNSVKEIIYANGTRLRIIYNLYEVSPDLEARVKHWVIKADIGAPFLNHLTFGLEYCLRTGMNLEVKGGVIGPGFSSSLDKSEGYLVKAGVKFVKCEEELFHGQKYTNPMKGIFLKPEAMYSRYEEHKPESDITYTNFALNFILGKQFVFGERFSFEFFGGLGIGFQKSDYQRSTPYENKDNDFNYVYSHIYFGQELPLAISGGLTIGFVF